MKLLKTRVVDYTLPQAIIGAILLGLITVAFIWSPFLLEKVRQKIFGGKEAES